MTEQPTQTQKRPLPVGLIIELVLAVTLVTFMIIRGIPTWQGMGDPVAFRIGPLAVRWYGILLMVGAYAGARLGEWEARRRGVNPDHVWNILLWGLILGVTVSRLFYVLGDWRSFAANPIRIIGVEGGRFVGLQGLTIHGALLGAVLAVILYVRWARIDFFGFMDIGAPGFIMGQVIGRWGNFFNQEAYGLPTTLPWGLRIGTAFRIPPYTDMARFPETTLFHPTFLYEMIWNLAVCILLLYLARRYGERLVRGEIFWFYGMLYAVGRSLIELLRVDSIYLGPLPAAHVVSLVLFLSCAGLLVARRWIWKIKPGPSVDKVRPPKVEEAAGQVEEPPEQVEEPPEQVEEPPEQVE